MPRRRASAGCAAAKALSARGASGRYTPCGFLPGLGFLASPPGRARRGAAQWAHRLRRGAAARCAAPACSSRCRRPSAGRSGRCRSAGDSAGAGRFPAAAARLRAVLRGGGPPFSRRDAVQGRACEVAAATGRGEPLYRPARQRQRLPTPDRGVGAARLPRTPLARCAETRLARLPGDPWALQAARSSRPAGRFRLIPYAASARGGCCRSSVRDARARRAESRRDFSSPSRPRPRGRALRDDHRRQLRKGGFYMLCKPQILFFAEGPDPGHPGPGAAPGLLHRRQRRCRRR